MQSRLKPFIGSNSQNKNICAWPDKLLSPEWEHKCRLYLIWLLAGLQECQDCTFQPLHLWVCKVHMSFFFIQREHLSRIVNTMLNKNHTIPCLKKTATQTTFLNKAFIINKLHRKNNNILFLIYSFFIQMKNKSTPQTYIHFSLWNTAGVGRLLRSDGGGKKGFFLFLIIKITLMSTMKKNVLGSKK